MSVEGGCRFRATADELHKKKKDHPGTQVVKREVPIMGLHMQSQQGGKKGRQRKEEGVENALPNSDQVKNLFPGEEGTEKISSKKRRRKRDPCFGNYQRRREDRAR